MNSTLRRALFSASAAALLGASLMPASALACGPESYLGNICFTAASYCPKGTMPADGRLLPISQYSALFSLMGTTFGGNGQTTFGLPDLRGRAPVGTGQGTGMSNVAYGQAVGQQSVSLLASQMPIHNHPATFTPTGSAAPLAVSVTVQAAGTAASDNTTAPTATNKYLSASGAGPGAATIWNKDLTGPVTLGGVNVAATGGGISGGSVAVGAAGGSQPVTIQSPALGLMACVVSNGIYPSRP